MKIISLWQPWATLIAYGFKSIETRGWESSYRGVIAIHAAKKWNESLKAICLTEPFRTCLSAAGYNNADDLPRGFVVAKAELKYIFYIFQPTNGQIDLTDCDIKRWGATHEREFGDYSPGRFGWVLADIERYFIPIPSNGKQGLWEWQEPDKIVTISEAKK